MLEGWLHSLLNFLHSKKTQLRN